MSNVTYYPPFALRCESALCVVNKTLTRKNVVDECLERTSGNKGARSGVVVAKTSVEASRNLASFVQVRWPTGRTRPLFGSTCQIRERSVAAAQPVFVPAISASWPPRSRTLVKWRYFHTSVTVDEADPSNGYSITEKED